MTQLFVTLDQNSTPLLIALAIGFFSMTAAVTGPLLLSSLNNKQRKAEKEQDAVIRANELQEAYRRQDQVAARAVEVAEQAVTAAGLLKEQQEESIRRTEAVAARVAEATRMTDLKLTEIDATTKIVHDLVNSSHTMEIEGRLVETQGRLVALQEIVRLNEANGNKASKEALLTIKAAKDRITLLEKTLERRHAAQEELDKKLADIPPPDKEPSL